MTGNGLFEKAKLAKEKQENAQLEEDEKLGDYENKIGYYVDGTREQVLIDKEEYENLKLKVQELDNKLKTIDYNINDILDLNSSVKEVSGTIKKYANVVHMDFTISFNSSRTANTWYEIGTIKAQELIPNVELWGSLKQATNGGNFIITSDGVLKVRATTSSTVYIAFITYIVD